MVWGQPVRGREKQANNQLRESVRYLKRLQEEGRIERFEWGGLAPQAEDLWGFALLRGTTEQIDALRRTEEYARWVLRVSLVADRVRVFDATVDEQLLARNMQFYDETIEGL
ncbi:MAG: hypothetical protein KGS09_18725 [Nitrospirae bacterium]|nr:hypothetical protein [Nitrospirota bacterium]MBU6482562.1 hypothetical protein [Nitrospirota bacterium]MDE3041332.1 hypothetical protein [Nitrospirota bacterium]MDE3049506.1 hypothetical protein [Nitrospirota bacterium]MDE3219689.1 hypothetical protein [Nitrospirota bacterium]